MLSAYEHENIRRFLIHLCFEWVHSNTEFFPSWEKFVSFLGPAQVLRTYPLLASCVFSLQTCTWTPQGRLQWQRNCWTYGLGTLGWPDFVLLTPFDQQNAPAEIFQLGQAALGLLVDPAHQRVLRPEDLPLGRSGRWKIRKGKPSEYASKFDNTDVSQKSIKNEYTSVTLHNVL